MTDIAHAIWTLNLVVEKSEKLQRLRFTRYLLEEGRIGFGGEQQDSSFVVTYEGPDEEAIDAFLFTFRLFVQNNDSISLAKLEELFKTLPLEQARIDAVVNSRKTINDFLDQSTNFIIGNERLKRRYIFEVFLWGGLAHANRHKKKTYDEWIKLGAWPMLQSEFVTTLVQLLNAIFWFEQASREALAILQGAQSQANQPAPGDTAPVAVQDKRE